MTNFDIYADPAESSATGNPRIDEGFSALNDPQVGYGEDIAKGAAGGLGRGVAGTLGIGGTVGDLARYGLSKAGVPEDYLNKGAALVRAMGNINPLARAVTGPDASSVQKEIENYTGKFYQPLTVPGQYASTIAEFAPAAVMPGGSIASKVVNTLVPAVTSETVGQLTKGTAAEPYARAVAALASGPAAAKALTPLAAAEPTLQRNVDILTREGIPLTAGQRTGNKALQWAESNAADMPGANRARQMQTDTADAYNRYLTNKTFDRGELTSRGVAPDINFPDPSVSITGQKSLSDKYGQIFSAHGLQSDPTLQNALTGRVAKYEADALTPSTEISRMRDKITDAMVQGQGSISGDQYQKFRSQIGTAARDVIGDTEKKNALRGMKQDLDAAMARGLPPDTAKELALNNLRYANMKTLEPAIAAAGETLTPAKVAQAVRSRRASEYIKRQGNLDEVVHAANAVLKPLPNSGTAARTGMQQLMNVLPNALAGSAGGAAAGSMFGPVGAIAGAAAPFVVPKLITSKLGQAYLGNQLMPQNTRDILAQTMSQQAASGENTAARNRNAMDVYEQMRRYKLRQSGL